MKQLLSLIAPLALGLFVGKYYGEWIEPVTALSKDAISMARGPASVMSMAPDTESASVPSNPPEAALALFSHMRASEIRSVCETARELFATKSISSYARYIRDFSNYTDHDMYLKNKSKALVSESRSWRGTGTLAVGESKIDLEVLVTPPKEVMTKDLFSSAQECYTVQIYASRDGGLRQTESGNHCISDLAFRDGSYYFTWAGASGSFYHLDIAAILIALPRSKSDAAVYMTDGKDEWQQSETFTWTPVSDEEQSVRLAQLLTEMNLVGQ